MRASPTWLLLKRILQYHCTMSTEPECAHCDDMYKKYDTKDSEEGERFSAKSTLSLRKKSASEKLDRFIRMIGNRQVDPDQLRLDAPVCDFLDLLYAMPAFQTVRDSMPGQPSDQQTLVRVLCTQFQHPDILFEKNKRRDPEQDEVYSDDCTTEEEKKCDVAQPSSQYLNLMAKSPVEELKAWFDGCDTAIYSASNGLCMGTAKFIIDDVNNDYLCHYDDPHGGINEEQLAYDIALCDNVCPLYTIHHIAYMIGIQCSPASEILSVLLHCLRYYLDRLQDGDQRKLSLLSRILALYMNDPDHQPLLKIPSQAETMVAAMYHTDVPFLRRVHDSKGNPMFVVSCPNIHEKVFGFNDMVRTCMDPLCTQLNRYTFLHDAITSAHEIINDFNLWLQDHDDRRRSQLRSRTLFS
jgi:hypothetical protein